MEKGSIRFKQQHHSKTSMTRLVIPMVMSLFNVLQSLVVSVLRPSDCFGRIGGEEFAAILFDTELGDAVTLSEKLRRSVEQSIFHVENQEIKITISIGVTQVKPFDTDIKNLMSRADKAMYLSKHTGRNNVSHYDEQAE